MNIINFKKKKNLLTKEQQELYENVKICYTCKEKLSHKYVKDKKYHKFWDHFHYTGEYRGAEHNVCNLKYDVLKKCFIAFPNGSSNNYRFFIKQLKNNFQ